MGVERVEIQGFRSLKHVVWEPSNLNVLIGPNGSGKSNTLDALKLLSAAASGEFQKLISKWRGLPALTWNGSMEPMSFSLNGRLLSILDELCDTDLMKSHYDYRLVVGKGAYSGGCEVWEESLAARQDERVQWLLRIPGDQPKVSERFGNEINTPGLGVQTGDGRREAVRMVMARWRFYQGVPVERDAEIRRSAEARRAEFVSEDGSDLISVLHTLYTENSDFRAAIDDAMRAGCGDDYQELQFPPAEDTRIQLRLKWKSLSQAQSAAALSDGIVRFLLLITLFSAPRLPGIIAIDEPEAGLHPSMLPIIAEYAAEASRKSQIILTSHSPEMLSAFSGTNQQPRVTIAFWEDGQTVLRTPRQDVLEHWLKEYTLGQLMSSGELEEIAE